MKCNYGKEKEYFFRKYHKVTEEVICFQKIRPSRIKIQTMHHMKSVYLKLFRHIILTMGNGTAKVQYGYLVSLINV